MKTQISCTLPLSTTPLLWLIGFEFALAMAYVLIHILDLGIPWGPARELFDLDAETSIPTWFSSVQLFVVGAALFLASRNNRWGQRLPSWFLMGGSLFFFFLSADEGAEVHEKITVVAHRFEMNSLMIKDHGAWIPVYLVMVLCAALASARYLRMIWRYLRREALIALCGTAVLVTGGVVGDVISYLFLRSGATPTLYKIEVVSEELLEMIGVSIILYAVLLLTAAVSSPDPATEVGGPAEAARR